MVYIPPAPAPMIDASGMVIADITCRKCSYNLRSLNAMGRCPECGTPIGLSTHGDHLRFCEPAWMQRLSKGLIIMFVASLIGTIMVAANVIPTRGALTRPAITALVAFAGLLGTWMMTEPDPGRIGQQRRFDARTLTRWTVTIAASGNVLILMRATVERFSGSVPLFHLLYLLFSAAAIVAEWAKYSYISELALRVPDDALARKARRLRIAFPVGRILVTIPAGVTLLQRLGTTVSVLAPLLVFIWLAGVLVTLVSAIMGLSLISRMRKVITREALIASTIWRREVGDAAAAGP